VIDAASLLAHTSVFVGGGGTMTAEAALLGVPTFSCYPGKPFLIEKFLISKRLITREANWRKTNIRILQILKDPKNAREVRLARAKELTDSFEDPVEVIMKTIEKIA
jgi:predicted glycosyltransferase